MPLSMKHSVRLKLLYSMTVQGRAQEKKIEYEVYRQSTAVMIDPAIQ